MVLIEGFGFFFFFVQDFCSDFLLIDTQSISYTLAAHSVLGWVVPISQPKFAFLKNGDNDEPYFLGMLWESNQIIQISP